MKLAKRAIALFLSLTILAAVLCTAVLAAYNVNLLDKGSPTESYNVVSGVSYKEYKVHGGKTTNGNPDDVLYNASFLTFSTDEYIPVVYSGRAGNSGTLVKQYQYATQEDGYDVAAIINGAFFSMDTSNLGNYGTLVGMVISDGRVVSTHAGYSDSVVAFDSDGKMSIVNSTLSFELSFDGKVVPNGLFYINKHSGKNGTWNDRFYYFDRSCGTIADTASTHPGYEIICEKQNHGELTVGATLEGKVVAIRENSYGASIAENQFVLFCTKSSTYSQYAESLSVGSTVEIFCDETSAASKDIMRSANSVITNVGWLVKDGVDQTEILSTIGTHSTELTARWTAFGTKADGSYVFFTSEGGSTGQAALTLKDVAKLMIAEGCNNVIRMDGGGSSAMYVCNTGSGSAGYQQSSSRSVGDCILVVKRSSMRARETGYTAALAEANTVTDKSCALQNALSVASNALADTNRVYGDLMKATMQLNNALTVDKELQSLYTAIATESSAKDYTESSLNTLWNAYDAVEAIKNKTDATVKETKDAADLLKNAYNARNDAYSVVSVGCPYTLDFTPNATYDDEGGCELTDGLIADPANPRDAGWVGQSGSSKAITVDLGKVNSSLKQFSLHSLKKSTWGINAASQVKVYVSTDNVNFTLCGNATATVTPVDDSAVEYRLTLSNAVAGRYVKIIATHSSFLFITEVTVKDSQPKLTQVAELAQLSGSVASGSSAFYTGGTTGISGEFDLAVTAKWNDSLSGYLVTSVWNGGANKPTSVAADSVMLVFETSTAAGAANAAKLGDIAPYKLLDIRGYSEANGILYGGAYAAASTLSVLKDNAEASISGSFIYVGGERKTVNELANELVLFESAKKNGSELNAASVVGTGAIITTLGTEYTAIVAGDIDGNGAINALDYLRLKRHFVGTYELSDAAQKAGDIDNDGTIKADDYLKIKRYFVGTYNLFG